MSAYNSYIDHPTRFQINDRVFIYRERYNPKRAFGIIIKMYDLEGRFGDTVATVELPNGDKIKEYLKYLQILENPNDILKGIL